MQVTLERQYPVAAGRDAAWRILSDLRELAGCMPGAQITEQIDDTRYKGTVRVKIGPAVAAFAGDIDVLATDADAGSMHILGKGADKAGSSASMDLTATLLPAPDAGCLLAGKADVIVNGKFAQFGGRMMTSVADTILSQFAEAFSAKAQALQAAPEAAADGGPGIPAGIAGGQAAAAPGPASPVPRELNALALLWRALRNYLTSLFGRKA